VTGSATPQPAPSEDDAVLAIDVGGTLIRTAVVAGGGVTTGRLATATPDEPWSIDRLVEIATDLHDAARDGGARPEHLVVAVPGQVDEYHGAVQFSSTLPWHDVAVADALATRVPVEVTVRHSARVAALAEANLGAPDVAEGTLLYVSVGTAIVAAGAQSGIVVADHAGAGDQGRMRIRTGPGVGRTLDEFASTGAIARRYAAATGAAPDVVDAEVVYRAIGTDPAARTVWDEAIDALADGLEWSMLLFAPRFVVVGGGLVNAGDDLIVPLRAGVARRLEGRASPDIRAATFGDDAGWVGAALTGWRRAGWPTESLRAVLGHGRG
jgi:glucokinase